MALSFNPLTRTIFVPQADLTFITGSLYELDTNAFRLLLKDWEDSADGMVFPDTHRHNTQVTVAGTTYARTLEIINHWKVEFENGLYTVRLVGSNNNIFDVENGILVRNNVSVIPTNSAGLINSPELTLIRKFLINKMITDPVAGTLTIYDDDSTTTLVQGDLFEDAAGVQPYRGQGAERREKLT